MLNTAIIGCGAIHSIHAAALSKSDKARLCAVVDIDKRRAEESAGKYDCIAYTDYHDALDDRGIDVVHICLPHYLHAPVAIDAMRSEKHVLLEKPIAISKSDAEEVVKVAEQTGMRLGVCFQNRYNRTASWIKQLIDSGKVGKVKGVRAFVTWHRDEAYYRSGEWRGTWDKEGGGVLINQAIHTIDMLRWFVGEVVSVKASFDTRLLHNVIEVEDTAEATIFFECGAIALLYATNCFSGNPLPIIELDCEGAYIRMENNTSVVYRDGTREEINDALSATGEKAYWGISHERLIEDFYGALRDGRNFAVDGKQGIAALEIVNAMYESGRIRKRVELS